MGIFADRTPARIGWNSTTVIPNPGGLVQAADLDTISTESVGSVAASQNADLVDTDDGRKEQPIPPLRRAAPPPVRPGFASTIHKVIKASSSNTRHVAQLDRERQRNRPGFGPGFSFVVAGAAVSTV